MEPAIWTSNEAHEIGFVTDDDVMAARDACGAVNLHGCAFDAMGSVHECPGASQ